MSSGGLVEVVVTKHCHLDEFEELASFEDQKVIDLLRLLFRFYKISEKSIEVCFMSSSQHTRAHKVFLNNSEETDVIAFPYHDSDCIGEILVNVEVACKRSKDYPHTALFELLLYVVHGALHLIGFDDHLDADIREMRAAEKKIMSLAVEKNIV